MTDTNFPLPVVTDTHTYLHIHIHTLEIILCQCVIFHFKTRVFLSRVFGNLSIHNYLYYDKFLKLFFDFKNKGKTLYCICCLCTLICVVYSTIECYSHDQYSTIINLSLNKNPQKIRNAKLSYQ